MIVVRSGWLSGILICGACLGAEPAQDSDYSTAFSPIFAYGPVYGAVIGAAVFQYPAAGAQPAQPISRQLFVQGTLGGQLRVQASQRQSALWQTWEHRLSVSVDNFFDYEFPDGVSDYRRFDRWRIGLNNELGRDLGGTISDSASVFGRLSVSASTHERDGDRVNAYPGLGLRWDNRESGVNSRQGTYAEIAADVQPDALHSEALNDTGWRVETDLRHYVPVLEQSVLALRVEGSATDGDVFDAALGGDNSLRGYVARRLVGDASVAAQSELRFPLFGWVSGVAFAESGWIESAGKSSTPSSFGGGLRFGLPPDGQMKVRADLGFSEEGDPEFFVSFNQVF
jgi:outer membrane protein assembly factor BamA